MDTFFLSVPARRHSIRFRARSAGAVRRRRRPWRRWPRRFRRWSWHRGHDADHGDGNWFLGSFDVSVPLRRDHIFRTRRTGCGYYELPQTAARLGSAFAAGFRPCTSSPPDEGALPS